MSDGCRLCYAELVAARFSGPGQPYEGLAKWLGRADGNRVPRWTGEVRVIESHMRDPLRWKKPRMVFVNSMSDLFHEKLPDAELDRIVAVMGLANHHTFQPLTKRAERMSQYLGAEGLTGRLMDAARVFRDEGSGLMNGSYGQMQHELETHGRLPNVWWGVSAEDQKAADQRIPYLLGVRAAVRWVSYEPALGPIDFTAIRSVVEGPKGGAATINALTGGIRPDGWAFELAPGAVDHKLHWIVVGGESDQAPQIAHAYDVGWALDTQLACAEHGVAFFHKQLGSNPVRFGAMVPISDRMGKVHADWPEALREAQAYPGGR